MTTPRRIDLPELPDAPYRTGRHVHHDPRSVAYGVTVMPMSALRTVQWQRVVPPFNQGNLGSCHDDQTEILTRKGWLPFPDLTTDNEVATVDPVTGTLIYERPSRVVALPYDGDLYVVENARHNFAVTPDHTMLVRKWDERARTLSKDYSFVPMKKVGWYAGLMESVKHVGIAHDGTYTIPGIGGYKRASQRTDLVVPLRSWLRFLGIYLAEGTMFASTPKCRSKIQIAAFKEREKVFVRNVLSELGVRFLELRDRFTFENARIYQHMESLGLKGIYAAEKFVPDFVFDLPGDDIAALVEGHREGDGSLQKGCWTHHTSSPQLATDLQRLIFLAGHKTGMSIRQPRSRTYGERRITSLRLQYQVRQLLNPRSCLERKHDVRLKHYSGAVYCAEVPTFHTLVTRRGGSILISGNCTGNAAAGFLVTASAGRKPVTSVGSKDVNELYAVGIYEDATHVDSVRGIYPPTDTGSTGLAVAKVLKNRGLISSYRHAFGLRATLSALQTSAVLLGTVWRDRMFYPASDGRLYPIGKDAGGHEIIIDGIDVEHQRVWLTNSWGSSFGVGGRCYLNWSDLDFLLNEHGDVTVPVP